MPDSPSDVERFIALHGPLPKGVALPDAPSKKPFTDQTLNLWLYGLP
ncbi:MAG: hypothetical protein KGI91_04175 [Burkholderiales bacterium]|nr:hypothetical protein [Burkholderiales bacterium]MDE2076259.1 hypothetical protein [Burkholderiales bacterium]MDE2433901.1 hypothetical protein [Burkholderiales bacterium]